MKPLTPLEMIGLGLGLALLGWAIPLLTVLKLIQADLFLLFFSQGASVAGLLLGLVGATRYVRRDRR
jgi:hypothetical protein